jgi:hypothetical protein
MLRMVLKQSLGQTNKRCLAEFARTTDNTHAHTGPFLSLSSLARRAKSPVLSLEFSSFLVLLIINEGVQFPAKDCRHPGGRLPAPSAYASMASPLPFFIVSRFLRSRALVRSLSSFNLVISTCVTRPGV